jgi:hypothetical protein
MSKEINRDLPLITAHLLGGTSGLNLTRELSETEIRQMVRQAIKVALEIETQIDEVNRGTWRWKT